MRRTLSLTCFVLVLGGLSAAFVVAGRHFVPDTVTGHVGSITLAVSPLRAESGRVMMSELTVTNQGRRVDELDTALAAGGMPVSLSHNRIGNLAALDLCGGGVASRGRSQRWLHDGAVVGSRPPYEPRIPSSSDSFPDSDVNIATRPSAERHVLLRQRRSDDS